MLPCGFSLNRNDFQSFDALASAFNPAEVPLRFHKKGTRYFRASDLASVGKNEDKTTLSRSPPKPRRFWTRPGRTSVWWDNFDARKVVEEEWIRIRRCRVDGRKRYENDKCGRKSFGKRSKTAPFSFKNGLV